MKIRFTRLLQMMSFAACLFLLPACGGDKDDEPDRPNKPDTPNVDPNKPVADPSETVTLNILNTGKDYKDGVSLGNDVYVYIDAANNLHGCWNGGNGDWALSSNSDIIDIGEVAGLGNIVSIPTTGYSSSAAVVPGHGYVIKSTQREQGIGLNQTIYVRLYVVDFMTSTSGGIMGATVKYQNPFQLSIRLEKNEVTFDAEGTGTTQYVKLVNPTPFTVKSKPEWIKEVTVEESNLKITADNNIGVSQREGSIILSNSESEVTIKATQRGASKPLFAKGAGTASDPFIISSAIDLDNVRQAPYAHFRQNADIDLANYSSNGTGWNPIDNFTGAYDGDMHKIKNIYINSSNSNVGLFGTVDSKDALIKGIILEIKEGAEIKGTLSVGGIAGNLIQGTIQECSVKGKIRSTNENCGGIASFNTALNGDRINSTRIVERSRVEGNLETRYGQIYGIAAYAKVSNCECKVEFDGYRASWHAFGSESDRCLLMTPAYLSGINSDGSSLCHLWDSNGLPESAKMKSTYEGWDFVKVWTIEEGVSLPRLRCFE